MASRAIVRKHRKVDNGHTLDKKGHIMNTKLYFIAILALFAVGTIAGHISTPESHYESLAVEAVELERDGLN